MVYWFVKGQNEGKLYIAKPSKGIHDKIVVVDTKYTINGSNNWLSNKSFSNSESSINFTSKDCALDQLNKIKNKYF
jgi:phosphatidylserine/phosphatidylglycerophosphate/cardiolipin synthase-like enzyme